jgi:hypothetical protein
MLLGLGNIAEGTMNFTSIEPSRPPVTQPCQGAATHPSQAAFTLTQPSQIAFTQPSLAAFARLLEPLLDILL